MQRQEHSHSDHREAVSWMCWYCPRLFLSSATRTHHMSVRHPRNNRLVAPNGFVELHHRPTVVGRHRVAVEETLAGLAAGRTTVRGSNSDAPSDAPPPTTPASTPTVECGGDHRLLGGLGVVSVPNDAYARGTFSVPRRRQVLQTLTAARIRAYYESMPEASRTRRLVHPSVGQRESVFNTPLLREVLKFSLSAGGPGMSQADQKTYMSVLRLVEQVGRKRRHGGRHGGLRPPCERGQQAAVGLQHQLEPVPADKDSCSADEEDGEISRAFPNQNSFVAAVQGEQRRVLSKMGWDETPLDVEGVTYLFYSRDLLTTALDLLKNARNIQLWGEELGMGPDGSRMRAEMMDSDLFLTEEATVRRRHGPLSFVLGVQLFVDEAVVSWSGAHYMYPIRVRVVNIRDRGVQWVTVGFIPHVGKTVARTAAARRRSSDSRNAVLQRCLAILLRRFFGASQAGVSVEFPGQKTLTAVPRIVGLVADQLGERSMVCLMGNACEFFCSHCMVRRGVAGGREGVGAPARDVTTLLDAQLEAAITRDRDPRPSLRKSLGTEHSALAFVPALGAVWGLATDNKQLFDIISFDLLHVWKLGVVRMVAQRFPSFLRVACAGKDARLGPVPDTLEALNLRAWEMGHLCVPSPTPPGYVLISVHYRCQIGCALLKIVPGSNASFCSCPRSGSRC